MFSYKTLKLKKQNPFKSVDLPKYYFVFCFFALSGLSDAAEVSGSHFTSITVDTTSLIRTNSPCSMLLLFAGSWGSCLPLRPVEGVPVGEELPWGCPLQVGREKNKKHKSSSWSGRWVIPNPTTQQSKRSIKGSEVTLWKTGGGEDEATFAQTSHSCSRCGATAHFTCPLRTRGGCHLCKRDNGTDGERTGSEHTRGAGVTLTAACTCQAEESWDTTRLDHFGQRASGGPRGPYCPSG